MINKILSVLTIKLIYYVYIDESKDILVVHTNDICSIIIVCMYIYIYIYVHTYVSCGNQRSLHIVRPVWYLIPYSKVNSI